MLCVYIYIHENTGLQKLICTSNNRWARHCRLGFGPCFPWNLAFGGRNVRGSSSLKVNCVRVDPLNRNPKFERKRFELNWSTTPKLVNMGQHAWVSLQRPAQRHRGQSALFDQPWVILSRTVGNPMTCRGQSQGWRAVLQLKGWWCPLSDFPPERRPGNPLIQPNWKRSLLGK